jgi:pimeloyl-ACP methyl ester carboxylesterase
MNDSPEADRRSVGGGSHEHRFVTAPDGLRLHVRDYGPRTAPLLPAVCLPGLARTGADFHELAAALATDVKTPRRVIALDYRGRGGSERDANPDNYSLAVELTDLRAVLAALECTPAVFIGTSRGGLLTMLLAAAQPAAVAGAILNDVGPVLEAKGLIHIKGYVGKLPQPRDWAEAGDILRRLFDAQFPKLTQADWREAAKLTWTERDGALMLNYDPKLSRTLETIDLEQPIPAMWAQFDALAAVPLMAIRGLLSDLVSAPTMKKMRARRGKMQVVEVADQGHPPALRGPEMIRRIAAFCRSCDATAKRHI